MKSPQSSGKPKKLPKIFLRRVAGRSMQPTLQPGVLVIARRKQNYARGEIIIFKHQGIEKVKRISDISHAGISVQGDDSSASTDSRDFGTIQPVDIKGVVIWPRQ